MLPERVKKIVLALMPEVALSWAGRHGYGADDVIVASPWTNKLQGMSFAETETEVVGNPWGSMVFKRWYEQFVIPCFQMNRLVMATG